MSDDIPPFDELQRELDALEAQYEEWQPYTNYKDSGVGWMGQIPDHWTPTRIKMLCQVKRGASPRPIDDPTYFDDEGEYAWVRIADVTASERYLLDTTQRLSEIGKSKSVPLEPGEIFLSIAGSVGKSIITKIKCCIHDGFVYFDGLKLDREFLYYVFSSGEVYKGLGKLGTQLNLNTETVGGISVPVPTEQEQYQIATFLDRETAKIDALIAKKEQLIALLQEQRSAIISHAVTKGLNPDAPMKDSGVEWLGEIPSHWETAKLKYICSLLRDGTHQPPQRVDEGFPLLSVRNIVNGKFINLPDDSRISSDDFHFLERSFRVRENDIMLAIVGATLGKVAIVEPMPPFTIQRSLAILRPKNGLVNYNYLYRVIESAKFQSLLWSSIGYSAQPGIYLGRLGGFSVPLPSLQEQYQIVKYIHENTVYLDSLIEITLRTIDYLQEYRTALISAAVTGKIDIRGEV